MVDYTVVCCISKPDVFDECLLKSLKDVGVRHNWAVVPILNDSNIYSASSALNVGIDASKSDIVIFVHQDIRLLDDWFGILQRLIDQMPSDWGILGCAGIAAAAGRSEIGKWGGSAGNKTVAVGSVWESDESLSKEPYWNGQKELTKIHCVDECLFVLNKKTGLRFDTQFTGFHLYGVDISLQARAAAFGVYGAHLPVVHYGKYSASLVGDRKYWTFLRFCHNKWRLRFPEMLGTHMHWAPNELTSYIPISMSSGDVKLDIKAMGIKKAKFSTDKSQHFIEDDL